MKILSSKNIAEILKNAQLYNSLDFAETFQKASNEKHIRMN